jgi:hypothetical protein
MPDLAGANDERDFAKQLVLYADTITAFAVAQLLAFVYLLAHGDCFAVNVLRYVWFPVVGSVIVSCVYFGLVWSCRRGETAMLGAVRNENITRLVDRTWYVRYGIIVAGMIFTVVLLFVVRDGITTNHFSVDCKCNEPVGCGFTGVK